jgi:hypothetical protein
MENTQNLSLTEKIKSMTAKEHIMNMVEGLRNPMTQIDMGSFGRKEETGICFGCAATNSICRLIGNVDAFFPLWKPGLYASREYIEPIIDEYETAINMLREGDIYYYNLVASRGGFATIEDIESIKLSFLTNDYTEEELLQYVALADAQE